MIAQQTFLETARRALDRFSTSHRIAGLIAVIVVAMFGAAQWVHSSRGDLSSDAAQSQGAAWNVQSHVEYFPAQYVNQATQPEKHIETF